MQKRILGAWYESREDFGGGERIRRRRKVGRRAGRKVGEVRECSGVFADLRVPGSGDHAIAGLRRTWRGRSCGSIGRHKSSVLLERDANGSLERTAICYLAAPLIAWVAVEPFIALLRSYDAVVPWDRVVAGSRVLWLISAVYVGLDLRFGWTRVALPAEWAPAFASGPWCILASHSATTSSARLAAR